MRWFLILFSALMCFGVGDAWAQSPPSNAGLVHQGGQGAWEPPTEQRDAGISFVEMAVWSTKGPPTISVNLMGEKITKRMQVSDVGVYSSTFRVPHGRLLPVELRLGDGKLYEDLVVLHHGDHRVSWMVKESGEIHRSSSPVSSDSMAIQEALILAGGALWILIVGLVLASGRLEKGGRQPLTWRMPEAVWLILWLALSVAFTWPSALSSNTMIVGRHFDAPGTLWVIGSAARLIADVDPLTAWPLGAEIRTRTQPAPRLTPMVERQTPMAVPTTTVVTTAERQPTMMAVPTTAIPIREIQRPRPIRELHQNQPLRPLHRPQVPHGALRAASHQAVPPPVSAARALSI